MSFIHPNTQPLVDPFTRRINYLRISVTDRCDLRCQYCMTSDMNFLKRSDLLSFEEIVRLVEVFASLGTDKIRLTGGEPLTRRGISELVQRISQTKGISDLSMTTNGSQLATHAEALKLAGLQRINISLDTLDADQFATITRNGVLQKTLDGISAAKQHGFHRLKINTVTQTGKNESQILPLVDYAVSNGLDISFIEEMPIGEIDRHQSPLSNAEVRAKISEHFPLIESAYLTPGPADYYSVKGSQTQVGFISPHSAKFCASCNRLRLTAEGKLLLCLGHDNALDLRQLMRDQGATDDELIEAIRAAILLKPEQHDFVPGKPAVMRFMSDTGG